MSAAKKQRTRRPKAAATTGTEADALAAVQQLRKLWLSWKGGPYVCGNAFRAMMKVDEVLKRSGF